MDSLDPQPVSQMRRNIDFDLVQKDTNGADIQRFTISRPFIIYNHAVIGSVEPKIIRIGEAKDFTVNVNVTGTDFYVDTGIVNSRVNAGQANIVNATGTLLSSSSMTFNYNVPTIGFNPVELSFDRDNYFSNTAVRVRSFQFLPAYAMRVAQQPTGGRCSIFGKFVTITYDLGAIDLGPERRLYMPKLLIRDNQFSRSVNCTAWVTDTDTTLTCPCVEIWDLNINLPATFKYALQFNGRDWHESDTLPITTAIDYAKPTTFNILPIGKFGNDTITTIDIVNIADRFDTTLFQYNFRLRNKGTGAEQILSCNPNQGPKTFTCTLAGLSSLCCPGVNPSDISCLTAHCSLAVVLRMGRNDNNGLSTVEFEGNYPFTLYNYFKNINGVFPRGVHVNANQWVNVTTFVANTFSNTFGTTLVRLVEKFDTLGSNPAFNSTNGRVCDTYGYFDTDRNLRFQVTPTCSSSPGLFDVHVSLNNATFDNLKNNEFRIYAPESVTVTDIIGAEGVSLSAKPVIGNVTVRGSGYFPSDQIIIRYYTSQISLVPQRCIFVNTTALKCLTPSVLDLGISLPMRFNVTIALNGLNHLNGSVQLQFEKSDKPVIVQVVPQRGPFWVIDRYPDVNSTFGYPVVVKGITTGVKRCLFQQKISDADVFDDQRIPFGFSDVPKPHGEEVECRVPVHVESFARGNGSEWRLYLIDTDTNQRSDPFTFTFYRDPDLVSFFPIEGNAYGRETIVITGANFVETLSTSISFRLAETRADAKCVTINNVSISCTTPAHQEGSFPLYISYNDYQYKKVGNISYAVRPCPAGNFSRDFDTQCQPCSFGTYKPLPGFFDCIDCEEARYQPLTGQDRCEKCPAFTTTVGVRGVKLSDCDCEPGYFRPNETSPGIKCDPCPPGGICKGRATLPQPRSGFWFDQALFTVTKEFKFSECKRAYLCTGNITDNNGCIAGHTGEVCEKCWTGYFNSNGDCKVCDNDVRSRFVVIVIVVIVIVILVFRFAQLKVSHLSSISIAVSYFQIIAVFSAYNFKWPKELKDVMNALKVFNLDLDIVVPECITDIRYPHKYGLTLAMPLFFLIVLVALFFLEVLRTIIAYQLRPILRSRIDSWFALNRRNFFTKELTNIRRGAAFLLVVPRTVAELKDFADKLIHTYVIIVSFCYVFIITKAAEIFNCEDINGRRVMGAYKDQECYKGDWFVYMTFSLLTIVFFGGGVLAVFSFIVFNRNAIVKSRAFNNRFRFLFIRFRNERLYWEIVIIIRKLLISIAIIFFSGFPMLVVLFSMLVIFIAFILQTHHLPYRRNFHNIMEYIVLLTTEFLLFSGLLFYVDDFPDSWNKTFLGVLCICVGIGCAVGIIFLIILDFIQQMREDRHERLDKRKKKQEIMAKIESVKTDGDGTQKTGDTKSLATDTSFSNTTPKQPSAPTPSDKSEEITEVPANQTMDTTTAKNDATSPTADAPEDDDEENEEEENDAPAPTPLAMMLESQTEDDLELQTYANNMLNLDDNDKDTLFDKFIDWLDIVIDKFNKKKDEVYKKIRNRLVLKSKKRKAAEEDKNLEMTDVKTDTTFANPTSPNNNDTILGSTIAAPMSPQPDTPMSPQPTEALNAQPDSLLASPNTRESTRIKDEQRFAELVMNQSAQREQQEAEATDEEVAAHKEKKKLGIKDLIEKSKVNQGLIDEQAPPTLDAPPTMAAPSDNV